MSRYDLNVMKDSDALMFVETSIHNGSSVSAALLDLKMIDTLLHVKKIHFAIHGQIKTTKRGHLRKGSTIFNVLDNIVDGFVNEHVALSRAESKGTGIDESGHIGQ